MFNDFFDEFYELGFFTTLNSQSTTVLRSSPSIMVAQGGMVKVGAKNPLIHS